MATNIKKLKSFINEQKEEAATREERKNRSSIDFYQNKVGKNCLFLLPPHENMDGLPFVLRGKHRNCGPEGKTDFMCISNDGKKQDKCPQCNEVRDLYNTKKEKDKKKAGKMRRNQRFYWQIIDVAPVLDLDKSDKLEIPECLLDYPGEENKKAYKSRGCKACDWEDSCQGGIRAWSVGKKIQEPILDELEDLLDDDDVTNPKAGRPVVIRRKGEEAMDTEYSGVKFLDTISFPKEVIGRIYEKLIDLSAVSVPKDEEGMRKLMTGISTEDADEDESSDDTPTCFGKYDDDEKDCLKCDYCDPCEVETNGADKGDDSEDEDDEDPKEEIDPELDDDDDPEEDELEKQLKARAKARAGKRTAQSKEGKRTPAPKDPDDDDDEDE